MYKLKQVVASIFFAVILLVTPVAAVTVTNGIEGTVTLPTSITDLLGTCNGAECPSINIGVLDAQGWPIEDRGASVTGGSVDFIEGVYQYSLVITDESAYGERYVVVIDIRNGDMGNEILYYDFGSDRAVGTTGDSDTMDSILHEDDAYNYGSLSVNSVYMYDVDIIQLNTDLTNKNDGRQKLTGKIKLPDGMVFGSTMDGHDNSLNISIGSPGIYGNFETIKSLLIDAGILDIDGLYTFTTSIKNESNISMDLSLALSAILDGYEIDTYYQIGVDAQDVDDHSIDGDEKLITGWNLFPNYATFSTTIVNFGTLDVDAYLVGAKLFSGTLTPPVTFPVYSDETGDGSISLLLQSTNYSDPDFQFWHIFDFDSYSTLNANGTYDFQILFPLDIQGKITENKLSLSVYFYGYDYSTGVLQDIVTEYTFGDDQQIDDTDHIFEGLCPTDAQPLSLDFSAALPVLDINTSNYILPVTYTAELTLTLPEGASYPYMGANDTSCEYYASSSSGSSTDNGDGTFTLVSSNIREGHEYGFTVNYQAADYTYDYFILNDDDGDFTNGGTFLDAYEWDPIFDQTYTATANDVVFSPIGETVPTTKVNPSIIMYLLH